MTSGGSIRVPAAHNGIYGLKPTTHRLPSAGIAIPSGSLCIEGTLGPLSSSAEGLKIFMRTVLAAEPWLNDPTLVPIPWRDTGMEFSAQRKLRVAILSDDGLVKPDLSVKTALERLCAKLQTVGSIELLRWQNYQPDPAWDIIVC